MLTVLFFMHKHITVTTLAKSAFLSEVEFYGLIGQFEAVALKKKK